MSLKWKMMILNMKINIIVRRFNENVDNYDNDTGNSNEGGEFNEGEFGAEFVQSLQINNFKKYKICV